MLERIDDVNAVRHETTFRDNIAPRINRRQSIAGCKRDDDIAVSNEDIDLQLNQFIGQTTGFVPSSQPRSRSPARNAANRAA